MSDILVSEDWDAAPPVFSPCLGVNSYATDRCVDFFSGIRSWARSPLCVTGKIQGANAVTPVRIVVSQQAIMLVPIDPGKALQHSEV